MKRRSAWSGGEPDLATARKLMLRRRWLSPRQRFAPLIGLEPITTALSPSVLGNDLAQNQIDDESEPEADEPGVVIQID